MVITIGSKVQGKARRTDRRDAVALGDIAQLIGATPMLELPLAGLPRRVGLRAKAEWLNPGGSVKDRAALEIVREAEAAGHLPGRRLLDASSGNTAIAYAMLGAARGFGVTICLPGNASAERKALLRAYGAEVVETDPLEGSDGAIRQARQLAEDEPGRYFYADQYGNPANARAHYATTGPEIWRQTGGRVTHLVVGLGTTGTLMGCGRFLRERRPEIELVAVEPDEAFHGIEGLKHLPTSIVPRIFDPSTVNRTLRVGTEEAYDMTRRLGREHGLLVGPSSGAAAAAALRLGRELDQGCIVTIFPDDAERYLSLDLW
ncbi:MAG: PLP-dependent cysteine synthase family protein [Gemmatimonadetes bacterium]|uniref:cysteine synthase n=1 Tax=Candidatus Kutchimonas denitrificans TaxID=3056748 RepID=A0AAE4Z6W6_9BACT|nr:PLP-dependent cysteine synthase family protein [Gemmatimonadota bacterium]NIR74708.1 PLP-dependent cysteine synthase family protein [Candidatus Kutchimonas denitrificans]NIS01458.1 PLP-dependent cysteine synthase family protein [Gemmatimonadota bacterium]NIT67199.1 PLP-dependent cysteine synthase family protein [Gemmatimonadota bacterium]NIU52373.1 pyridoxal-phosphate dependent enzyme [Gemmatimonadota bacterium]